MKRIVALTAVGADKPGIVAGVTGALYRLGCNLEETSMTLLRRDFAMIMLISVPDTLSIGQLKENIKPTIDQLGLSLNIRELSDEEKQLPCAFGKPNYILSIYGIDKPGIVYKVSEILAQKKINITDLETQTTQSGKKNLYALILEIYVPENIPADTLKSELTQVCRNLSVDFSLDIIHEYNEM